MSLDRNTSKYVAEIRIEIKGVNQYGDVLNDETHIAITRTMEGPSLAEIVARFEKA